ncbi:hypothetical protein G6F35_011044 [Rhizopus arrhizus]|nr:hypothetical protein G6F35_011044 [Rhizopus arrhizus]
MGHCRPRGSGNGAGRRPPSVLAARAAVLAGRDADGVAKHPRQVAGVAEAAGLRDAGQVALAGGQQAAGVRQAPSSHPRMRRFAERGVEHASEVVGRQRGDARQLVQRQGFVQMCVHVIHAAPAHGGRQAAPGRRGGLAGDALAQQVVQHGFRCAAGRQPVRRL